jgi:acetyl-CoA acetyltransferase
VEHFGEVAVACREHALLNDNAIMKKPITLEDHRNSRLIAEPFRLLDCSLESDGGAAIVVSSAERAADLRQKQVYISGVAEGHPDMPGSITQRPDMTSLGIAKGHIQWVRGQNARRKRLCIGAPAAASAQWAALLP